MEQACRGNRLGVGFAETKLQKITRVFNEYAIVLRAAKRPEQEQEACEGKERINNGRRCLGNEATADGNQNPVAIPGTRARPAASTRRQ